MAKIIICHPYFIGKSSNMTLLIGNLCDNLETANIAHMCH